MEIEIVKQPINIGKLIDSASKQFGDMVKAVVDIDKEIMAIGGELHADEETVLLEQGSKQEHLWGINLLVDKTESEWIEYDSMINIRPSQNNRSRMVEDITIKDKIQSIVKGLVER